MRNGGNSGVERALIMLDVVLDERDRYTREHCNRLVSLSEQVGKLCDLESGPLQLLREAALLHDIGKIGIPDSILLKPSPLSPKEWEVMKSHAEKGERILREYGAERSAEIGNVIRYHHEYFNGDGYPDALAGEDIPIQSRIISVVDSYDAMTTRRVYSETKSHEEAISIMREEEGEKSDPYVFKRFLEVVGNGQIN